MLYDANAAPGDENIAEFQILFLKFRILLFPVGDVVFLNTLVQLIQKCRVTMVREYQPDQILVAGNIMDQRIHKVGQGVVDIVLLHVFIQSQQNLFFNLTKQIHGAGIIRIKSTSVNIRFLAEAGNGYFLYRLFFHQKQKIGF